MAATAVIIIQAQVTTLPSGGKTVGPFTTSLSSAVSEITDLNSSGASLLQAGDNTINVPTGATMAFVTYPAGTYTVTRKGAGGDTGIVVVTNPTVTLYEAFLVQGATSFILNTNTTTPGIEVSFT